jgi:ABC-type uncharacterized transport system substrate-binding protein
VLAPGLVLLAALLLTPVSSGKVDVIVTGTNPNSIAAEQATTTIPIVMTTSVDPVGAGLVASRALGLAIPPSLRLQADRIVE